MSVQCHLCAVVFSRQSSLSRHIKSKHNGETYQCSHCSKSYTRLDILRRHEYNQHQVNERRSSTRSATHQIRSSCVHQAQRSGPHPQYALNPSDPSNSSLPQNEDGINSAHNHDFDDRYGEAAASDLAVSSELSWNDANAANSIDYTGVRVGSEQQLQTANSWSATMRNATTLPSYLGAESMGVMPGEEGVGCSEQAGLGWTEPWLDTWYDLAVSLEPRIVVFEVLHTYQARRTRQRRTLVRRRPGTGRERLSEQEVVSRHMQGPCLRSGLQKRAVQRGGRISFRAILHFFPVFA